MLWSRRYQTCSIIEPFKVISPITAESPHPSGISCGLTMVLASLHLMQAACSEDEGCECTSLQQRAPASRHFGRAAKLFLGHGRVCREYPGTSSLLESKASPTRLCFLSFADCAVILSQQLLAS